MKQYARAVALGITISLAAALLSTGQAQADEPTDVPIVIDMTDLSSFHDANDDSITVSSDTTTGAQRTITGSEASGDPVVIVVYLNSPESENPSRDSLNTLTTERGGEPNVPPPAEDNPQEADTSGFVPQTVIATTASTISVGWTGPSSATRFTLSINGSSLPPSSTPSFTVTGLVPDQAYQLAMESTYDQDPASSPETPPVSDQCPEPQSVVTTNLNSWDLSGSGSGGVSLLGQNGLQVMTVGNTTTDGGASGKRAVSVPMAELGTPSIEWDGASPVPAFDLTVDFNGDGEPDGVLTQSAGSHVWALNSEAAQFVKDTAPIQPTAPDTDFSAELSAWQGAFLDGEVTAIGFDQRNDAPTQGVLVGMTLGCTTYSFRSTDIEPAPATVSAQSSYVSVHTLKPGVPVSPRSDSRQLNAAATLATADPGLHSSEIAYRTFIPYETLNDSPSSSDRLIEQGCIRLNAALNPTKFPHPEDYTFVGDNRGFQQPDRDPNVHNYRTSMDFAWDWDQGQVLTQAKSVGQTTIVRRDDRSEIDHHFASTATMTFDNLVHSPDYAAVTLDHVANDPFCPHLFALGAISYQVRVSMYRSGLTSIWGDRFTMPSHEAWVRWNSSATWSNAFEGSATTLACLIGGAIARGTHHFNNCRANVVADISRTTDKWVSYNGQLGATQSGRVWGSGNAALFSPHADGSMYCTVSALVSAPPLPSQVKPLTVQVEEDSAIVLASDHHIYTWGSIQQGGLGRTWDWENDPNSYLIPTSVDNNEYKFVDQSRDTAFAVTTSGDIYTWGTRFYDTWTSEVPDPRVYETPTPSLLGADIDKVKAGDFTAVALDTSGHLYVYGVTADGFTTDWAPLPVPGVTFQDISIGANSYYAIDSTHRLWAWGQPAIQTDASDPDNPYAPISTPSLVTTGATFAKVSRTEAVDTEGKRYSWPTGNWYTNISIDSLAVAPITPPLP
ncbi:hypothetical protein [Leifsonia poae]|uniref:hypothetical protein n=1 Tax=Leifsonia poae TaxID=110933 RepID=UPI003D67388C